MSTAAESKQSGAQAKAQAQGIVELRTSRLLLRGMTMDDVDAIYAFCADKEVARGTMSIPHPYTRADAVDFVERISRQINDGAGLCWGIVLKETGELIGDIGLELKHAHFNAEAGFVIGTAHWGKGYVPEALREMMRYGFEELGLHRIFAHAMDWNDGSKRVMEKVGMRHEGTLKEDFFKWGRFESSTIYGLTKKDWLSFNEKEDAS
jgi:RimJ/RimL family protein N-acetyltransferase